jgi:hypothetical protein
MSTPRNLKNNINDWQERICNAPYTQFGNQVKYFFEKIENEKVIKGIIHEACTKYNFSNEDILERINHNGILSDFSFKNETEHVAFNFQLLKYFLNKFPTGQLHTVNFFQRDDFEKTKNNFVEEYIATLVNFIQDRIEKSNSIIFLLEKYKKRTEWFNKKALLEKYHTSKNHEQILEDDLRLFLFDQGIEYPFSTPKSPSGRADIVGNVTDEDLLICEIKIFDSDKNYRKDRIKKGLTQIIQYTNDYNKDSGYLVIFNMDDADMHFNFDSTHSFPPKLSYGNKTYYFIVVNIREQEHASMLKKPPMIDINLSDLIEENSMAENIN